MKLTKSIRQGGMPALGKDVSHRSLDSYYSHHMASVCILCMTPQHSCDKAWHWLIHILQSRWLCITSRPAFFYSGRCCSLLVWGWLGTCLLAKFGNFQWVVRLFMNAKHWNTSVPSSLLEGNRPYNEWLVICKFTSSYMYPQKWKHLLTLFFNEFSVQCTFSYAEHCFWGLCATSLKEA